MPTSPTCATSSARTRFSTVDGESVAGMGYPPDLLMMGNPSTDEFSHMFLGLTVPVVKWHGEPSYYNDV